MRVARLISEVRAYYRNERPRGTTVAFVPTMGALHEGHMSLIRRARDAADLVVVSIFVNPLQFGPREDFDAYPRDEARDVTLVEQEGVNLAFLPSVDEMYPDGAATTVHVDGPLATTLEGASRPGHFDGVATVVAKLFNVVDPDVALFGQKDAQQAAVIRRMVRDLCFRTEIVVGATVREPDGLALSSRNAYLAPAERDAAPALYAALTTGEQACRDAGPEAAAAAMRAVLDEADGVEPDYAAAVDPYSFGAPADGGPVLLAVAARVGGTRLIDNVLVHRS
ncbi:MAG TPA: pantoate--beta-alanine ligase [Actinomycetota bacterium]|nr:pantoate--beta-alanine ligase [Actinomycetota bacterium]